VSVTWRARAIRACPCARAVSNVTIFCGHRPGLQLTNTTYGAQVWDQKAAMTEVSEIKSLGWWQGCEIVPLP
jgi:hypothetical protein